MLEDSDRLLATIEQILRTGRFGRPAPSLNRTPLEPGGIVESRA